MLPRTLLMFGHDLTSKTQRNIAVLLVFLISISSNAQCAMCRAALETEDGGNKAEAVNDGIVYLMVIPYVLVAVLGVVLYRMYTKKKAH